MHFSLICAPHIPIVFTVVTVLKMNEIKGAVCSSLIIRALFLALLKPVRHLPQSPNVDQCNSSILCAPAGKCRILGARHFTSVLT